MTRSLTQAELEAEGEALGRRLEPGELVTFEGELGAGKTTFIKAVTRGLGVTRPATSPTYALVHRYEAQKSPVYHIDLYRLDNESQLTNIGWDDILGERALVIVEWPERAGDRLPGDQLHIDLDYSPGDESRRILLAG